MPSDDLAARLRALRRSDAVAKVAKPAHIATSQPIIASQGIRSKVVKRDDVDELIARTRDEVDVAREQGELSDEDQGSIGEASSPPAHLNLDVGAEGKAFRSMAQGASSDAAAALREHRKTIDEGTKKLANLSNGADKRLTLEAKARPVLVRPTSSYQGEAGDGQEDDAIASELADAMGDIEGTSTAAKEANAANSAASPAPQLNAQPPVHKPPPSDKAAEPIASREAEAGAQQEDEDEIEIEVKDFLARFTALRPSASRSASAASTSSSMAQPSAAPDADASDDDDDDADPFASLNLPSAPSTALQFPPPAAEPPTPAHPTLGPSHSDISSDRDLSPFHRLVSKEFNVSSRLANPATAPSDEPLFPSTPRSGLDEEEGDEIFCSLCSEDASLTCSCPGDEYEGCAGDAYCSGCWVEAHGGMGREELREHRTKDVATRRSGRRGGGKGRGQRRRRAMAA